ncbi:MAG: redoxin domain-containing protein [Calditrichaceae bacterium]
MKKISVMGIITLILMLMMGCGDRMPEIGEQAPDFILNDVDGKELSLNDFRGKLVFLHFWGDWCSECRSEFPVMQNAYEQFGEKEQSEILCVNVGQSKYHVDDFRAEFNVTFPMLVDEYAKTAKRYKIKGIPTTFVLSGEGVILEIYVGWLTQKYIFDRIGHRTD